MVPKVTPPCGTTSKNSQPNRWRIMYSRETAGEFLIWLDHPFGTRWVEMAACTALWAARPPAP